MNSPRMKSAPVLQNESLWFTYFLVFLFFMSLGYVTLLHHEMWRDELQAWLIATGSASVGDLFTNIQYERHPALWYLSLYLLSRFSEMPIVMQAFHILLATTGIYLFTRFAPFTKIQKFCFAFGYFPFFEYGVISRSYVMGLVCLFAFCALQGRTRKHSLVQGCALALLANTSLYGAMIAFAFGIYLVVEWLAVLRAKQGPEKSRILLLSLFIVGLGVATSIVQIMPPPDSSSQVLERGTSIHTTQVGATLTAIERSYVPIPRQGLHFWNSNILEDDRPRVQRLLSIVLLGLAVWILVRTPVTLVVYAVATVELLAFTHVTQYGIQPYGGLRHIGHLFLVLVGCLWIFLSRFGATELAPPRIALFPLPKAMSVGMITVLFAAHAFAGVLAVRADLQYPFSASKDVAQFLKEHHMTDMVMIGSRDYAASSVAAYLNRALYYAEGDRLGTFVVWEGRRSVSSRELIRKAEDFAALEHRDVLLILNYDLDLEADDLVKIRSFDQSIVKDERYVLYRKSYCMDDAIRRSMCVSGNHPRRDSR
jgi:hypothetical protein